MTGVDDIYERWVQISASRLEKPEHRDWVRRLRVDLAIAEENTPNPGDNETIIRGRAVTALGLAAAKVLPLVRP